MKAERFNIIMGNLETRITEVSKRLDRLTNKDSYKQLTVADLEDMTKFFPKEQSLMDQIIKVELYHILGADLSPVQQSQLISRIKKYTSYRSDLKRMAAWIGSGNLAIGTHPTIPTKSEYQLSILGNFKLEYGVREGVEVEDTETVCDDNIVESVAKSVPTIETTSNTEPLILVSGKGTLSMIEDLDTLIAAGKELKKSVPAFRDVDTELFAQAVLTKTSAYGFSWKKSAGYVTGTPTTTGLKNQILNSLSVNS